MQNTRVNVTANRNTAEQLVYEKSTQKLMVWIIKLLLKLCGSY
jgi:hypothetical protein